MDTTLDVISDVKMGASLDVTGGVTMDSTLDVMNDVSMGSTLNVIGDVTMGSKLLVTSDVSMDSSLEVSDSITSNTLYVENKLDVSDNTILYTNTTIKDDLTVDGHSTMVGLSLTNCDVNDLLTIDRLVIKNANSDVRNTINGSLEVLDAIYVEGDASFSAALSVYGDITADSSLDVSNDLTVHTNTTLIGDVSMISGLTISGDVHMNSNAMIHKATIDDITVTDKLNMDGDLIANGKVYVDYISDNHPNRPTLGYSLFVGDHGIRSIGTIHCEENIIVDGKREHVNMISHETIFKGPITMMESEERDGLNEVQQLNVEYDSIFHNNVDVYENLTISGELILNSGTFSGNIYMQNSLDISENLYVHTETYLDGDVSMGAGLTAMGDVSFESSLDVSDNLYGHA